MNPSLRRQFWLFRKLWLSSLNSLWVQQSFKFKEKKNPKIDKKEPSNFLQHQQKASQTKYTN
jgi:hypothetical protein